MIGLLNSLFRAISPLWEMSLTAAYAAVVVALLRLVLKKRAPRQVLCLLWLVVFARLLIPVPLESPVSIVPDARQVQQLTGQSPVLPEKGGGQTVSHQPAVQNPAQGQAPGGVTADPVSQGSVGTSTGPALTAPGGAAPFAPQPELPAPFPWQAVVAGVWLAGVLVMGGYGLLSYLRLRRRLYDAIRAGDGAWEHPAVTSPFILGVLRPRIYLPAGLQGQPRQFILCHERAHLRRCDHIVKPVCWAALALHWFNPMVWAAFLLMSRDIEAACDEAVIRRLGPGVKADYSATLLSLATNGRVPAPCPLAFDEGDAKGRIKNVLRYRRPALWIVVVSVVMAAVAAVCLLTDPVSAEPPEDGGPGPDASASQDVGPSPAPPEEGDAIADPWMLEVLSGERDFRIYDSDRNIGELADVLFNGYPPENLGLTSKLALLDLDRDGGNELVIFPQGSYDDTLIYQTGYLILRREGDTVRGCAPGWRSMGTLKADGTFNWGGSAMTFGIGRARFDADGQFEVEEITWRSDSVDDDAYFVNGLKASREEFDAAVAAQDAKPEVTWYVYEGGQLWPAPPDVPFRPDSLTDHPGPRDLTQEELDYFQEYFWVGEGGKVPNIRTMLLVSEYSDPRDIDLYSTFYHGFHYVPDFTQEERDTLDLNGIHEEVKVTAAEMDQTLRAYLGLGLEETNKVGLENFHYLPEYDAYYTKHTDFWGDWFTMRSGRIRADGTIALVYEGTNYIPRGPRVAVLKEAEQVYAHRLYYQVVSNVAADEQDPYAAIPIPEAAPAATPDPTPEPSAAPVACEHGLDNAVFEFAGGILVIYCEEDGTRYPVPAVTAENYKDHMRGDFDNDGHFEVAFTRTDPAFSRQDGTLLMADVVDGEFRTYVFDPSYLADDFNDTVTYEFLDEYRELRFTYQGYGMGVDLSEQWDAMMNHGRSYYPYAYAPETTYAFDWDRIDMMIPIYLENGFGGHICYLSWSHLRYTGSGFQLASSSFGYRMPS